MKESDITPEVIKLSKEITRFWMMVSYEGGWVYYPALKKLMLYKTYQGRVETWFPIPSISDCLEKLREKYKLLPQNWKDDLDEGFYNVLNYYISISKFHEWLLSALLEVLKK